MEKITYDFQPAVLQNRGDRAWYYRWGIEQGQYAYIMISEYELPGFKLIPKHYIGAYQAALERKT